MNANASTILDHVLQKPRLRARIATADVLDVRSYSIRECMSDLFQATLFVRSSNQNIDFDAVVGHPASITVETSDAIKRTLRGVCSHIHQIETANSDLQQFDLAGGLATYQLTIVPSLWFATQRRNHRMFQRMSDPDIVLKLLKEWNVTCEKSFDESAYKKRKYRVQYGESDYAFMCRLLEDAGIAFYFNAEGVLVLTDVAESAEPRPEIPYNEQIVGAPTAVQVSDVTLAQRVAPGAYTIRDHDYRRASSFVLNGEASLPAAPAAARLERYHYIPGAFLFESDQTDATPSADDKGKARHDPEEGKRIAERRLDAKRGAARFLSFQTTAFDLRVGDVFLIANHPHAALATPVLVLETVLSGAFDSECRLQCEATTTSLPFRPPLATPKPRVMGVESATVVGPAGQEIHTDEFGRVRVHFHWDRESKRDDDSSCWIHVSQGWAGATFGAINLPRVGQEVIVDFLGGDPDRPVIVGRVFTNLQRVPYPLPANKTKSGWRSQSTPGGDGYNEIMFEDKKGCELVSMHAERDMATVVEHDQKLDVRNLRTKTVGSDETVSVGGNRSEDVGQNERIAVAGNRTRTVGASESVAVGASRSRQVGGSESVRIGVDRTHHVGNDDTLFIGGVATRVVNDEWGTVRGDSIQTVGHDVRETILHDRFRSVGNDETFAIGNNLAGSVAGNSTLAIDKDSATVIGGGAKRSVGAGDELSVTASQNVDIGACQSTRVGADVTLEVGASSSETVAANKSSTVAGTCALAVGAALVQTVAGASTETVGTAKRIVANEAIQLESGVALLRVQQSGELLLGRTSLDRPFATFKVEGEETNWRLVIGFGASRLLLGIDGTVAIEGVGLSFNGEVIKGAPTLPMVPPPPPLPQE